MLNEEKYNRHVREDRGLVATICLANGFTGADLDDMIQRVWLELWKTRHRKRDGEDEKAYLAGIARKVCAMAKRAERRMMRDAPELRFEERDTGELSSTTVNGAEIFKSADQERLADQKRLNEDLVALAGMMRSSHGKVVLNRLNADAEDVRSPTPAHRIGMLRESRRLLQLPEDNPGRVEITNPAAYVARMVRDAGGRRPAPPHPPQVLIKRTVRKENACAAAPSPTIISRENEKTQVQTPLGFDVSTESSSPSFNMKCGRRTQNTSVSRAHKRSTGSTPPKSASAPSRRQAGAIAPSPAIAATSAPTSRRRDRRSFPVNAPSKVTRSAT